MTDYIAKGAQISPCGKYRYQLWREWRLHPLPAKWDMWSDADGTPIYDGEGKQLGEPQICVFIMLNPSTADGNDDDPTVRRCVAFAKSFGYDRMEIVNLFAYRATSPKELLALMHDDEPWGPRNKAVIEAVCQRAGLIVCAWGAHGTHLGQDETVMGWIDDSGAQPEVTALQLTKDGHPAHPLYLRGDLKPVRFDRYYEG